MDEKRSTIVRATDPNAATSAVFLPGADPDEWIEQQARPYRERPWAVIRELFQNANDAIVVRSEAEVRLIELALLDTDTTPKPDRYHLVIRDSGIGMDDNTFCATVGILGAGSKKTSSVTIGKFGVGFYSTHAICIEVVVLSRPYGTDTVTAWRYLPQHKIFYRLDDELKNKLLLRDFEKHPISHRCRKYGTSVYLNIDFANHRQCEDWLVAESLLRDVRRDFFLLPSPVFLANLTDPSGPLPIYSLNQVDLSNTQLNLDVAPWDLEGAQQTATAVDLLRSLRPNTKADADLPSEWGCFSKTEGTSKVEGMFYFLDGSANGHLTLCLKRMWVETPRDLSPQIAASVYGVINIEPAKDGLDVDITPHRDHLVRDDDFDRCRTIIQEAMIDFMEHTGERLIEQLEEESSQIVELPQKIARLKEIVSKSAFFATLVNASGRMQGLLADIPASLKLVIDNDDCPPTLVDHTKLYVKTQVPADQPISKHELPRLLDHMQESVDKWAMRARKAIDREEIVWSPQASADFLMRVGRFLPVTVAVRERRREGGFNVLSVVLPVCAITLVHAKAGHGAPTLLKGSAEEYLARNTKENLVVVPVLPNHRLQEGMDLYALTLALATKLGGKQFPSLEFKEHSRDLFQDITTADVWIPLVECFERIINSQHPAEDKIKIEASGYRDETVPILIDAGNEKKLVINAYNRLMQDLQTTYDRAAERNDDESINLIGSICHELYHHAVPAEVDARGLDKHVLETRNSVFSQMLSMLQKYNDLRA